MIYPKTFRKQIFLTLFILAFLPIIIIVPITLTLIRDLIIQRGITQLETLADLKTHHIDEWIAQGQNAIGLIIKLRESQKLIKSLSFRSNTNSWLQSKKEFQNELQSFVDVYPYVKAISLLHPTSGRVEISTDSALLGRFRNNEIYFKGGRENIFVSPVIYSVGREKPILVVSGPLKNENGEVLALVAAEMDLADLQVNLKSLIGLGSTGRAYLIDTYGFNITLPQGEEGGPLRTIIESEGAKHVLSKQNGYSIYQNYRGIRVLGVYRWMKIGKMGLLVEMEYSELVQPIKKSWVIVLLLGFCLLVLSLLFALRLSKLLVTPIKNISETARVLQGGDLSRRSKIEGADEFRFLATSFNNMADSIQNSHDNLEQLVNERTIELMRTNEQLKEEISERRRAGEALRESEERYRDLYDQAPVGYLGFDAEGRITNVNKKELEMFGYTYEEMVGQFLWDFVLEKEAARKIVKAKLSGDMPPSKGLERTYIRKDGTTFPVIIDDFLVKDKNGRIKGIRAINRDITDIKQAEEEKMNLEAQLQQAQKLESIGTLAGGIAHDFNNILSPIMIHSEMAMMDLSSDNPVQHSLKEILKAGERARDLVKQILTFSRKREGERAAIKITPTLKEVLKLLRSSIPTTIDIQQNLEAESDTVFADPTQIHQIMLNLGTNAAHAMREKGGTLTVSLVQEDIDSDAASQYSDLNPGSYLKLCVSDTGSGIDDETMERIFEPYFTTKEVGEGTGMGLALVHGIVKNYGGDITVESAPGKGTTFNVYLPRIEADVSPVEEPSAQLPKGTERILFVDDEKPAINAIQPMLENLGYKVTARTSSLEALEAFRNKPQGFDLVITDQTMPNMTGKDLAKELMSIRTDIPIILCTGFSEQIDEKKAMLLGIRSFVMKPIVMREIANAIRQVLDKK